MVVVTGLAASVYSLSFAAGTASLLIGLILTRGLGQSALSIVSIAMIGKWFRRRLGAAMGLFTVLLTFGFIGTVVGVGEAVQGEWVSWREMWRIIALSLAVFVPVGWLLVRSTPEASGVDPDPPAEPAADQRDLRDLSLREALQTPAFWVFVCGASMFNLVWSGVTLFNESILAERGFDAGVAVQIMGVLTGVGLLANLAAGVVVTPRRIAPLLGVGLVNLAVALGCFPSITTLAGVRLYAAALGATGGVVTVVFFAAWAHAFGREHLGRIQGAAQVVSVLASAIGPLLFAETHERTGSYGPVFIALAVGTALLATASFFIRLPDRSLADVTGIGEDSGCVPALQPAQES